MLNDELLKIIENLDSSLMEQFLQNAKPEMNVYKKFRRVEYDYSWLDIIEATIEDLDTIVRNPRKFIIQEEEIVPIEKAKKISQETIKHLAQHTNLIQDVDEDGTITPSSVLNVHKEESYDIYENRFIYSLLKQLVMFLEVRKEVTAEGSSSSMDRKLSYVTETKVNKDNIKVSLNIETKSHESLMDGSSLSPDERIEKIELIIMDFFKSPFIKELLNSVPVKSPIRKTNVILKNQNFKKALALWEFLERYDVRSKLEINDEKNITDVSEIQEKVGQTLFLDYMTMVNLDKGRKVESEKVSKYYLGKIIQEFVKNNDEIDEKEFKKIINNEFKNAKKNLLINDAKIKEIFEKDIERYEDIKKAMLKSLRK